MNIFFLKNVVTIVLCTRLSDHIKKWIETYPDDSKNWNDCFYNKCVKRNEIIILELLDYIINNIGADFPCNKQDFEK